jgi:hypothetical protein
MKPRDKDIQPSDFVGHRKGNIKESYSFCQNSEAEGIRRSTSSRTK